MTALQPHGCPTRQPAREPTSQAPFGGSRAPPAPDASDAAFTVTLSPAVLLILRLIETANTHLTRDEILSRAIGHFADHIGVPALARDMPDLPDFERAPVNRFETRRSRSGGP